MIRILNGKTRAQHPQAVDDMFRLRKRVFHDFLKWDVQTDGVVCRLGRARYQQRGTASNDLRGDGSDLGRRFA